MTSVPMVLAFALGAVAAWAAMEGWWRYRRRRYGRLLSFIVHEINTPLTALNMTALNFTHGIFGPLSKEHEEWMRLIAEQSARLSALLGDLRDLIHLEFHRDLRLYPEPVEAGKLVKEAMERFQGSFLRSGIELKFDVPDSLPLALMDPERLRRVLDGVLAHVRKFSVKGTVSVAAKQSDSAGDEAAFPMRMELTFGYHGNAVPPEEAKRMLGIFYPVDHAKSSILSSVGLGLGICRAVLDRSGGQMTFESEETTGYCRIQIRLPAAPARASRTVE